MGKIGIISLNTHTYFNNYGAILHSFAFQHFLKKNQVESEILDYVPPRLENWNLSAPWKSLFRMKSKLFFRFFFLQYPYLIRKKKIDSFVKTNMIMTGISYNHSSLEKAILPYKIMICESDVIWSNGFWDDAYFLALKNMVDIKKIAYSPSMADCKISEEKSEKLKGYLDKFDFISGRESYECDFLKMYTNKEVKHVCDPVFLLESDDYNAVTAKRMVAEDYLLLYLPVDNNKYLRECACQYAKKYSLKIVEVDSRLNIKLDHKCFITAGIEEFLSLIKHSSICFTNSFHAVSFSIIFEKEFYAFSRATKGKVEDVLNTIGLTDRFIEGTFIEKNKINYDVVKNRLGVWKQECQNWILNAIRACGNEK